MMIPREMTMLGNHVQPIPCEMTMRDVHTRAGNSDLQDIPHRNVRARDGRRRRHRQDRRDTAREAAHGGSRRGCYQP